MPQIPLGFCVTGRGIRKVNTAVRGYYNLIRNKLMWAFYGYVLQSSLCKFSVICRSSVQEQYRVPALELCVLDFDLNGMQIVV